MLAGTTESAGPSLEAVKRVHGRAKTKMKPCVSQGFDLETPWSNRFIGPNRMPSLVALMFDYSLVATGLSYMFHFPISIKQDATSNVTVVQLM